MTQCPTTSCGHFQPIQGQSEQLDVSGIFYLSTWHLSKVLLSVSVVFPALASAVEGVQRSTNEGKRLEHRSEREWRRVHQLLECLEETARQVRSRDEEDEAACLW